MTFLARHSGMQTNQREARNIVLKFYALAPALLVMAFIAFLALFAFMYIINFMAGITIGLEFCLIYMSFVAGGTIDLYMFAT